MVENEAITEIAESKWKKEESNITIIDTNSFIDSSSVDLMMVVGLKKYPLLQKVNVIQNWMKYLNCRIVFFSRAQESSAHLLKAQKFFTKWHSIFINVECL